MFGTSQQTTPPFGSSMAAAFGNANMYNANTTIFGQNNQAQTNTLGASGTLFGQPSNTEGFTVLPNQPSLFGQGAQPQQPSTSAFQTAGSSNAFGNSAFGLALAQPGTVIKFVPTTSTDTLQISSTLSVINTTHQSITCMKEYETRSFEELRCEDYCANRKGPQQVLGIGTSAQTFGRSQSTTSLFGQPKTKIGFGTTNLFADMPKFAPQSEKGQAMFIKASTPFGITTGTAGKLGFTNTPPTNLFDSSVKPVPPVNLFATMQQQPGTSFGTSTFLGQQAAKQSNTNFFKPLQSALSSITPGATAFGQIPIRSQTNDLFQTTKPSTGFSLYGTNSAMSGGLCQPKSSGFGGINACTKPAQNTVAQSLPQQTPGFTFPSNSGNFLCGTGTIPANGTSGIGLFGQSNSGLPLQAQPSIQSNQLTARSLAGEMREMLAASYPYGYYRHLEGLTPKPSSTQYVTNPKELSEILTEQRTPPLTTPQVQRSKSAFRTRATMTWDQFETVYEHPVETERRINPRRLMIKKMLTEPEPIVVYYNGKIVDGTGTSFPKSDITTSPKSIQSPPLSTTLEDGATVYSVSNADSQTSMLTSASTTLSSPISTASLCEYTQKETAPLNGAVTAGMQVVKTTPRVATRELPGTLDIVQFPGLEKDLLHYKPSSSATLPDMCGIISTRPEYYTVPPLDLISKYKNDDGSCYIKGFTVGRMGFGNVYFPDVMDVSNLNIDKLVHFHYRGMCIYPDNNDKPPVGEELNRKAQITLDQVYPKQRNNEHELEKDPEEIKKLNYTDLLKYACDKAGTTFVEYRPQTGSWVFNVAHFSFYGLTMHEEETIKQDMPMKDLELTAPARSRTDAHREAQPQFNIPPVRGRVFKRSVAGVCQNGHTSTSRLTSIG